ncbi:MAG: hypothetical protein HZB59_09125 [Ignavibacteriales bacterium]|nr:hypothetical protein [Ignavibacteriales bacterium]
MSNIFLTVAIICVLWGVVSSIVIVSFLSNHGVKINYFLLRLLLPKYVGQYRKITLEETGKPGGWYYSFVISMISGLTLAIFGILLRQT